jgi:hypothetical protein
VALTGTRPPYRLALIALAAVSLVAGLWAGLVRLGWPLPGGAGLSLAPGPLMVAGVLGVVIGLERAVALGHGWAYGAPVAAGLGGIALIIGLPPTVAAWLFTVSSLLLVAIFVCIYRRRPEWSSAVMAAGAVIWVVSNGLWLGGRATPELVPWWAAFLVLTIAGERLELAQVLLPAPVRLGLLAAIVVIVVGLILSAALYLPGVRLAGLGLLLLGGWLIRYDVARRAARRAGLAGFGAICLLLGYVWLTVAGLLWLLGPDALPGAFWYDAMVHSVFLGFVFSMIFGHAPTIIPAVTGVAVPFERVFHLHVGLLHASLLLRIVGDLAASSDARAWGGLLNVTAMLLFALLTIRAARRASPPYGGQPSRLGQPRTSV